jgi:hypothetical protein
MFNPAYAVTALSPMGKRMDDLRACLVRHIEAAGQDNPVHRLVSANVRIADNAHRDSIATPGYDRVLHCKDKVLRRKAIM